MKFACIGIVWAIALVGGSAVAADCTAGKQLLADARQKIASSAEDEAAELLRQSIKACPTYEGYETLAELQAKAPNQWDRAKAADSFVAAHAKAKTSMARAETLYHYAGLLNQEGDPQNAYPLIKKARALAPARKDIRELHDKIEDQIQHPQADQITRALRYSFYKPLTSYVVSSQRAEENAAPMTEAKPAEAPTPTGPPAQTSGGSVNIPINFEFNSTDVDPATKPNIATLSKALADTSLDGKRFLFIGHCDPTGDEKFNEMLSEKRAIALRQSVIELAPSLQGRIDIEGHGAREPIDTGTDLKARKANRRLQVVVAKKAAAAVADSH